MPPRESNLKLKRMVMLLPGSKSGIVTGKERFSVAVPEPTGPAPGKTLQVRLYAQNVSVLE